MVVLQALSEYMVSQPPPENMNLNVEVQMGARTIPYNFNPDTAYAARSSRVSHTGQYKQTQNKLLDHLSLVSTGSV